MALHQYFVVVKMSLTAKFKTEWAVSELNSTVNDTHAMQWHILQVCAQGMTRFQMLDHATALPLRRGAATNALLDWQPG